MMGPVDSLDHSSRLPNFGSKMGIDATRKWPEEGFTRPWPGRDRDVPRGQAPRGRALEAGGAVSHTRMLKWGVPTVGVAQLVERWIVVPVAEGSNPSTHPTLTAEPRWLLSGYTFPGNPAFLALHSHPSPIEGQIARYRFIEG